MILVVRNVAEYDQPITLHTGEARTVNAGMAIQINTGTDRRLISYYASLVSYNFDVSAAQASGEELNRFNDELAKFNSLKAKAESASKLQTKEVYPNTPKPAPVTEQYKEPTVINDRPPQNTPVPRVTVPTPAQTTNGPVTILDSKLGEVVEDMTPTLPPDYPDDPAAAAEVARIEAEEAAINSAQAESDRQWYALDGACTDDALKKLLLDEFGENTRLKNRSKIIYHIMELAADDDKSVYELAIKYQDK